MTGPRMTHSFVCRRRGREGVGWGWGRRASAWGLACGLVGRRLFGLWMRGGWVGGRTDGGHGDGAPAAAELGCVEGRPRGNVRCGAAPHRRGARSVPATRARCMDDWAETARAGRGAQGMARGRSMLTMLKVLCPPEGEVGAAHYETGPHGAASKSYWANSDDARKASGSSLGNATPTTARPDSSGTTLLYDTEMA